MGSFRPQRRRGGIVSGERSRARPVVEILGAALIVAATFLAVRRPITEPVRLEVGAFGGGLLRGEWSRSYRADIDPQAAGDGNTVFYYRAAPANTEILLPLTVPSGPWRLTLRARSSVRSAVGVFVSGERMGEMLVLPGPWDRYSLDVPERYDATLAIGLAMRPLPLVPGAHVDNPELFVDSVEVESRPGLVLGTGAALSLGLVPVVFLLFARFVGTGARPSVVAAAVVAATVGLARAAPLSVLLAVPRLIPLAFLTGLAVHLALTRCRDVSARDRAGLAALVALGTLAHGSLVFLPDHSPPDIDIHVRRTLDLAGVPLDYQAMLRYGSQLPTASQDEGQATAALGEHVLIPYSPLPYVFYFAAHAVGLDLYWAMTALNAALAMAVAPWLFLVVARLFDRDAAWLATLLYVVDVAVWHHLGRSHAPAVFGSALGTAALLLLAASADKLDVRRRAVFVGLALGVGVLGYSSLVVLVGLFGVVLLVLLIIDARGLSPEARRGVATALVVGGLLAGGLFYFHFVPGLLGGASGVEAEPDLFPGRMFFIFHNESRQNMRVWLAGYWLTLLAGLVAAPFALWRAPRSARPILIAWLLAWACIMILKEPFLFPKLLRWAKEDQFLSPLLCVFIGAAISGLRPRWLRLAAGAVVLATAVWLEIQDFALHANSLQL